MNDTGQYAEMSARVEPPSAVSERSGEIEDHGVASRPETNVGQVVAGVWLLAEAAERGRSSVAVGTAPAGRSGVVLRRSWEAYARACASRQPDIPVGGHSWLTSPKLPPRQSHGPRDRCLFQCLGTSQDAWYLWGAARPTWEQRLDPRL